MVPCAGRSLADFNREQPKERDVQAKPLPRLPRTWSRVCHETGLFLRSIGLGVVVSTISGLFRKDFIEPTKVAISRNQVTASLRTLVHILPLGIAILEIVLNWGGFYYGADFTQLAYYQIAAKTHEITIQASLALVTLAVIRHEATSGAGLPFGAFLGGLQFLQVGYLWSPELWSSIAAKDFGWRRKIWVFLILIICGILATTVGPSSATLLIPRQIYWALPYSHFAVNGSFQDIWPDSVNGSMVPQECGRLSSASVSISPCPGGPWLDLYHTLQSEGTAFDVNVQSNALAENIFHDPLLPALKASVAKLCQTSTKDQVCGTTLHDVVLEAAYSNYQEFRGNYHIKKSFQDIEHEFHNGYFQPYTIASCFADVIQESNIEEPLQFPRISETPSELSQERVLISVSYPTRAEVLDTAGNASEFRLEWTELPQNTFGDQVIGVILLYPQDPKSNSSMNITTCTLGAGWGTSLINLSEFYGDVYFSRMHGLPAYWPNRVQTVIRNIAQGLPNYANISGYTFPQRRINIAKDWAEYLNPTIEIAGNQTTTAINMLISANPGQVEGVGIPRTLVSMLSNGLARNGIERGFQGDALSNR